MSKLSKSILFTIAGIIGIVILIAVALISFVDTRVYKSRVENAASEALGMEVRALGPFGIGFFPGLRIRLADVQMRNRGMDVASAKEVSLEIALLPVLRKEVRITRIGLERPRISLKRSHAGAFNFEQREKTKAVHPAFALDALSISGGTFLYEDEQAREGFEAENFSLEVRSLRIAGGNSGGRLRDLSFTADFACKEIRTKGGPAFS
ncbi:MAG: AsmA family protein, partial [Proteobacteria bacterium]|nr:AsmA family protein [Pseudomonadota bacterium]